VLIAQLCFSIDLPALLNFLWDHQRQKRERADLAIVLVVDRDLELAARQLRQHVQLREVQA